VEQELIKSLHGYRDDDSDERQTEEAIDKRDGLIVEEENKSIAENEPAVIQEPELATGSSCLSCAHYMTNIQMCHELHRRITKPEETNCNHERYEEGSCKFHNELVLQASFGFNIRN
jgi:hypothetical protein